MVPLPLGLILMELILNPKSLQDVTQDSPGTDAGQKGDDRHNHAASLGDRKIAIDQEDHGGAERYSGEGQPESPVMSRPIQHKAAARLARITRSSLSSLGKGRRAAKAFYVRVST